MIHVIVSQLGIQREPLSIRVIMEDRDMLEEKRAKEARDVRIEEAATEVSLGMQAKRILQSSEKGRNGAGSPACARSNVTRHIDEVGAAKWIFEVDADVLDRH